jgi:Putative heavy-metal chelation
MRSVLCGTLVAYTRALPPPRGRIFNSSCKHRVAACSEPWQYRAMSAGFQRQNPQVSHGLRSKPGNLSSAAGAAPPARPNGVVLSDHGQAVMPRPAGGESALDVRPEPDFGARLRDWVASVAPQGHVRVAGLWHLDCFFQPTAAERKFAYQILLAKTTAQGACYYDGPRVPDDLLEARVGGPFEAATADMRDPVDFALLDSIVNAVAPPPMIGITLWGSSTTKAGERADVIANEVERLCRRRPGRLHTVCNVGGVSLLVRELSANGLRVTVTDMDPKMTGREILPGTTVAPGSQTLGCVAAADVAVVTGMTLANDTLPDILATAREADTDVVMFCETGSGFAPFLIDEGVACVISEPFPFYIFDGSTLIRVYRRSGP